MMEPKTRESIIVKWSGMKPRERDAWVAEVVFGIHTATKWFNCYNGAKSWLMEHRATFPRYTTDISAAWTVVAAMGDCLHLREHGAEGEWEAMFCGSGCDGASGETAPLAICLAALIALINGK
jgi:hypothetical protein